MPSKSTRGTGSRRARQVGWMICLAEGKPSHEPIQKQTFFPFLGVGGWGSGGVGLGCWIRLNPATLGLVHSRRGGREGRGWTYLGT